MKKVQHLVSLAVFLAAFVSNVNASSVAFGVSSKYVGSNLGVFSSDPVSQTLVSIDLPKGLYTSVLCTAGLDDAKFKSNFGDEIDYTIGWSKKISPSLSFDTNASWWDMYGSGNFVALTAKVTTKVTDTISLSFTAGHYRSMDLKVYDGGTRFTVGAPFGKALSQKTALVVNPQIVYDDGIVKKEPALVFKPYVSIVYKTGKVSWNVVEVTGYSLIIRDIHDGRRTTGKDHVVFGSKATMLF